MDDKNKIEQYYYCLYHIYIGKHVMYHHVILRSHDINEFKYMDAGQYQYYQISSMIIPLTDKDKDVLIIKGLLMDGESLAKRFNKATGQ